MSQMPVPVIQCTQQLPTPTQAATVSSTEPRQYPAKRTATSLTPTAMCGSFVCSAFVQRVRVQRVRVQRGRLARWPRPAPPAQGTVTPCRATPEVFTVGSSSVCTFTEAGGIVSITIGTFAGL
jgi:hypothetical protein